MIAYDFYDVVIMVSEQGDQKHQSRTFLPYSRMTADPPHPSESCKTPKAGTRCMWIQREERFSHKNILDWSNVSHLREG